VIIETDRWGQKYIPRGTDFTTWERGLEYITTEGSSAWKEIRERHGLTVEDLESLSSGSSPGSTYSTGGHVFWEEVRMTEDRPGLPEMEHLCLLALLEDTSPGALLDRVLIAKGTELEDDD
jgi:hypothetical protein